MDTGTEQADTTNQHETLGLSDDNAGFSSGVDTYVDPLRPDQADEDVSLANFMSRPIIIGEFDWDPAVDLLERFDPWTLFFTDRRISNRISNYKLINATLHVRALVNGNHFYYGRAMMSYLPLQFFDEFAAASQPDQMERVQESQRPHIFLNPTNSTGGDLVLPFFTPRNALDITAGDYAEMGNITIADLFERLKHVGGSVDPISIKILAWAEDVVLTVPTTSNAFGLTNQMAESRGSDNDKQRLKASEIASAVANATGKLSVIPSIAPLATATSMIASGMSKMLGVFGYTRPVLNDFSRYVPSLRGNIASTDHPDPAYKLAVDADNELSIDPRIFGRGTSEDQLTIKSIAKRSTYIDTVSWDVGEVVGKILYVRRVDPIVPIQATTPTRYVLPAISAATLPFSYWRGSITYRIQVVCSAFHRGRLRVIWEPNGATEGTEMNLQYSHVVDITENTDFCFTIGWGQDTAYRSVLAPQQWNSTASAFSNPDGGEIDQMGISANRAISNGAFYLEVFNELTKPLTQTAGDTISMNIFVEAGDDFEVAGPNENPSNIWFQNLDWKNNMMSVASSTTPMTSNAMTPDCPTNIATFGKVGGTNQTNLIHFGEKIESFRPLLKRYQLDEVIPSVHVGTAGGAAEALDTNKIWYTFRRAYPNEAGFLNDSLTKTQNSVFQLTSGGTQYPFWTKKNSLVTYLSRCFAGRRGSMRWMVIPYTTDGDCFKDLQVLRNNPNYGVGTAPANILIEVGTSSTTFTDVSNVMNTQNPSGIEGLSYANQNVNPSTSVEIPYYSRFRFDLSRKIDRFQDSTIVNDLWTEPAFTVYSYTHLREQVDFKLNHMKFYCATADDFQLDFWVGMPVISFITDIYPANFVDTWKDPV
jgi:hypothetical protein